MLIALAGLPASGKSTLARRLREALPAVVLDKDAVRAFLFGEHVDYTSAQNDLIVDINYRVAAYLHAHEPTPPVIIDGRSYSERYQIDDLQRASEAMGARLCLIECVCSDAIAERRLAADRDTHPAADRDLALYRRRKATADPIVEPRLRLDTGVVSLDACVEQALAYIRGRHTG